MDRLNEPFTALPRLELQPGQAWPLGASFDGAGVNVAVFSDQAQAVWLSVFDATGAKELSCTPLPGRSGDVWHGRLPGAQPGLIYGLRAQGPWRPERGQRFNASKVLLDPWAREIVSPPGGFDWAGPHAGADATHPLHPDLRDNAAQAFKARVVQDSFDWEGDRPPATPLQRSVLYELHVRGFTKAMAGVPAAQRGTYAGLAHPVALAYLRQLGVTAVSLMPVQQHLSEQRLVQQGLSNYWAYNTLGFFCPEPRYAATDSPRDEFRQMVKALHAAGMEVILDVVYNHTPEGDERGPTLSWRGLDNAAWYRLPEAQASAYQNWSGCGNALNLHHPRVLQWVLDSLRYWVGEMHVDGFRFDLAPLLGREREAFNPEGAFFKAIAQDPMLSRVKLIAEPWDVGPGGYQTGGFPRGWLEWNDHFRDTARAFWLGGDCTRGSFAQRLAGSADLLQARRRAPQESVNYVVSHDGFTLHDLVSYDLRHNEANLEGNRDGHGHNLSWNCGFEGPTTDPEVLARRALLQRALLATVLLSQGTPMLAAGDEMGHTQWGNNNPYCQDNPITWLDWAAADEGLIAYTAHLIDIRRRLLPLGTRWYSGVADAHGRHDLAWLRRTGEPMALEDWNNRMSRILGAYIGQPGQGSEPLLMLFNGRDTAADFALPPGRWQAELDSTQTDGRSSWRRYEATHFPLQGRSLVLLRDVK
jgi:glycogen debranching enzyme